MESKDITMEKHQFIKEDRKKGRKQKWKYKISRKQNGIGKFLHGNNYLMLMTTFSSQKIYHGWIDLKKKASTICSLQEINSL